MNKLSLVSMLILLLSGCEKAPESPVVNRSTADAPNNVEKQAAQNKQNTNPQKPQQETLPASAFMTAGWVDLIPKDDLDALLNPPSYIDDIAENSAEDQIPNSQKQANEASGDDRYQQALASTRVISALNNIPIRIPAFIVPLEFDDEQRVTQFFMVPFFGACIHLPPPPPNQTIFVQYPQGFEQEDLTEPFWISGIIKTAIVENELATAAYTMEVHAFEPYTEE